MRFPGSCGLSGTDRSVSPRGVCQHQLRGTAGPDLAGCGSQAALRSSSSADTPGLLTQPSLRGALRRRS
ncbi:hypothetical protein E2C01_068786 [Portunus trituberculatus]|uniref:Uncharacterized protein n=1 Tax=Portunus trituberculatus TaxID=210409 RepID=A0A5B7I0G6_PORTR|nr:hypothetical protein [Portunus trituberculatus]